MKNTPKKILVIEDDALLLEAITIKLKMNKFEPVSFLTGHEAYEYLQNHNDIPDLIWLDFYLKDTDGLSFMRDIKSKPQWADIPVIVVSNSASPENVQKMKDLGVTNYLLKSDYRLEVIMEMLTALIDKK